MDSSVLVLLPRAPKELLAVGPLALYGPRPRHGKTGNPALDRGLRFLHANNQPRESSLGDWFGWGLSMMGAAVFHDWSNECTPRPRIQQPWTLVQGHLVTSGRLFPLT